METEQLPALQESPAVEALHEDPVVAAAQAADAEELVRLRRMLAEEGQAKLNAVMSVVELERQLAQAKAGEGKDGAAPEEKSDVTETLKFHLQRTQKDLEHERQARRAELISVRAQWHGTQKMLETERRTRRIEGSQAAALRGRLERDLEWARAEAVAAAGASAAYRKHWLRAASIVAGSVVLAVVVFLFVRSGSGTPAAEAAMQTPPAVLAVAQPAGRDAVVPAAASPRETARAARETTGAAPLPPLTSSPPPPPSKQSLPQALGRLNRALGSLGGRAPEDVLRAVQMQNRAKGISVCAFRWNGGQPSMLFAGGSLTGHPLADAVTQCADAVEKYR